MPEQALRETIRVCSGAIPLLDRHLARLRAGGCHEALIEQVQDAALAAAEEWPETYGRMTVTISVDELISTKVTHAPSSIIIDGGPVSYLVETDIPSLPPGAAKPADRAFWDAALAQAKRQGAHVAILVDHDGKIIDGSQATVWLRFGDKLLTPPAPPALAGVSRAVITDHAPELGYEVQEREVTTQEYESAEEVFLSTAVAGVASVRGREGEAAERLNAVFFGVFGDCE